ncbi:MAG: hypothetical protein ACO3FE_12890 [Planctomycetaceae bacterium]
MVANRRLQVRLITRWSSRIETTHAVFDREIAAEQADALLCLWGPSEELFTFPRRRAWYCCEPACQFRAQENGTWLRLKDRLRPEEFLWHGHLDVRFRVPHETHYEPLQMNCRSDRKDKAIAVVSNYGGNPLKAHPDTRFRNHLITSPLVDLFGRASWRRYRPHWYSWPGTPPNYQGEIPGDWAGQQKRELLSQYKVCVCLENMNEPGYFTEKFVEAVVAGCIPVYRASAEMRDTVLQGAVWFDPADSRWPGTQAIEAALQADANEIQESNKRWLRESKPLAATHTAAVFERIADILSSGHSERLP